MAIDPCEADGFTHFVAAGWSLLLTDINAEDNILERVASSGTALEGDIRPPSGFFDLLAATAVKADDGNDILCWFPSLDWFAAI